MSDDKISFEYKLKRMLAGSLLACRTKRISSGTARSSRTSGGALLHQVCTATCSLARQADPLLVDQKYYLPDDILYKTDRMSMAHSLEVRPPFLDHRIVEFAARLPHDLKIRGSNLKYILRELMRDKLPAFCADPTKEGFDIPRITGSGPFSKTALLDTVNRESVEATGLFHWPAVHRAIADHLDRRANYGYHLWGLLMLFLWIRRWKLTRVNT